MLKLLKKYFSFIFGLIFLISFSFYFGEEYLKFYEENKVYQEKLLSLNEKLKNFSLEKLEHIENVELYYTPDKKLLDKIVSKISNAENRIYLNTYIFSEKRIREEIIKTKKKGIDVKVILEKNPYRAYNINNKTYNLLEKNGIYVFWSNPDFFSFNHAKYLIIDNEVIISTGNISYSTFTKNRDFFVFIKDYKILKSILEIFETDFHYKRDLFYNENLVLSPEYSRHKLESILKESKSNLKIYAQYLNDDNFNSIILKKALESVEIEIIVRDDFYKKNNTLIENFHSSGIKIYPMKIPANHSKAILSDDKYLFIGSINISENSMDNNRELGVIFESKEIISKFKNIFKSDIYNINN